MLARAHPYKDLLDRLLTNVVDDPFYDYLWGGSYANFCMDCKEDNYYKHQWVNLDSNRNIVGYMEADINRSAYYISSLMMVNFKKGWNPTFARDMKEMFLRLFYRYNYNKVNFDVVTRSRNEKIYDKFISRYGGRIVGTFHNHRAMQNGEIRDLKQYEIEKDDFTKAAEILHSKQIVNFSLL